MLYTFNGDAHFHHIAIFGCNCLFFVGELVSWLTLLLLHTASRQTAVGGNTLDNETWAWNRYSEYCRSIGLGDNLFLEDMSRTHRIEIIGSFAVAVRQGQFSQPHDAPLAESTVSDTLNHLAAVFRENGHDDPKRDAERNVARLLRRQLRSYKKDNPKEVQQTALPVCVLRLILSSNSTELRQAMGELTGAAHLWAMRSCEYAKVPKAEQRQTKQLCIRNIVFIKDGESIDHKSPVLYLADCVLVTFERQKNDRKADTVTQWRTLDELLCPVKMWAC
jgi:hypothetical protein